MISERFDAVFHEDSFPLFGMVHLEPLPGSPRWQGSMASVLEAARRDAAHLVTAGFDGIIVENFGDIPFYPDRAPASAIAAITACCLEVKQELDDHHLLGVNVLRNDASAALGIAAAVNADLIRINVHSASMWTDQGLIEGRAHDTLRERRLLDVSVAILADVLVKHAQPPAPVSATDAARDVVHRGLADGIIVSGAGTGLPVDVDLVHEAATAVPGCPVLIGSGVTPSMLPSLVGKASGAIVGSWLKQNGQVLSPVDPERAAHMIATRNQNLAKHVDGTHASGHPAKSGEATTRSRRRRDASREAVPAKQNLSGLPSIERRGDKK